MKILILDDDVNRHEGFKILLSEHEVTHVWTYAQAIEAFRTEKYDMACLDHDLGDFSQHGEVVNVHSTNFKLSYSPSYYVGGMYDSSRIFDDGASVCVWLKNNPQHCPKKILIHSWNPEGATDMKFTLSNIPNIEVKRMEYRAPKGIENIRVFSPIPSYDQE